MIRHPILRLFSSIPPADSRAARLPLIGRIAYQYESGAWSEWHLLFEGGSSGWLSDAQPALRGL